MFDDAYEDAEHVKYLFRQAPKRLVLHIRESDSLERSTPHLVLNEDSINEQETASGNVNYNVDVEPSRTVSEVSLEEPKQENVPESAGGTYKYKPLEEPCKLIAIYETYKLVINYIAATSKDDREEVINISTFDINKSLKALTRYDTFEVDDNESNDGKRKDMAVNVSNKDLLCLESKSTNTNDICGIKFTRPDYYMMPPWEELQKFVNSDGRCIVNGLVIGRIGYGNVCYTTPVDLTNMNIDELVHFRYRELTIYPDDKDKPPLGQGLNQPAQITLDGIFPKDRKQHAVVSDMDYLLAMNFGETLKDVCLKHGTRFVDYRPDTGSWVFKVDHFSKYAFTDSDEEEAADRLEKFIALQQEKKLAEERRLRERQNVDVSNVKYCMD